MFNPSGFDYDLLIARLHGGVRAFQSLRAHRRQRCEPPTPTATEPPTAPPGAPAPQPAPQADPRPIALEPQAFISVGGRVVPVFGELGGDLFPAAPGPATAPPASEAPPPGPPRAAPEHPGLPLPTPPSAPAPSPPSPAPSPLKLPPPTPPPGLFYGQRRPAASDPPPATSPDQAATAPQAAPPPATPAHEAPSVATLTAMLAARADEEAQRLEKLHAEHRACIVMLLQQHRDELQARSEAEANRTAQLLRDVLAEHRAELARAAQAHADQLAPLLAAQRQAAVPQQDLELRSALLEHAQQQRDTTDELTGHITAVTTLVADLGQTIGMLAVAAAKESQASAAPRPTFAPPPRSTPPADSIIPTASPTFILSDHPLTPPAQTPSPEGPTFSQLRAPCVPPTNVTILHSPLPPLTTDAFTGDTGITTERRCSG